MIVYDPISQGTGIIQKDATGQTTVIAYPPSVDLIALATQATDSGSARSFMQDQWRLVAENMQGMGAVISSYS